MENKQTMIEVQNLCKSFHKLEVLKDISTTFYKNEVVSSSDPPAAASRRSCGA